VVTILCDSSSSKANILIDQSGHARLADFSLLTIVAEQSTIISSRVEGGTIQWMSPELIDPEAFGLTKSIPAKESDCYALGMVIYEILSGQTPFSPWKAPAVMRKVLGGERPGRPQGEEGSLFTDRIWVVLELCWKSEPCDRISARVVLRGLEESSSPLDGGGDTGTDTDDQWDTSSNDSGKSFFRFILSPEFTPNQSAGGDEPLM
jgi:serine/threonine protein kinase